MIIVKTIEIPNTEIEDFIDDKVIDRSLDDIETWLIDNFDIQSSDIGSPEYIFFLNIMKEKIDERIARWI